MYKNLFVWIFSEAHYLKIIIARTQFLMFNLSNKNFIKLLTIWNRLINFVVPDCLVETLKCCFNDLMVRFKCFLCFWAIFNFVIKLLLRCILIVILIYINKMYNNSRINKTLQMSSCCNIFTFFWSLIYSYW